MPKSGRYSSLFNPQKLVSLWEMIEFWTGAFLPIWERLDFLLSQCRKPGAPPHIGDGTKAETQSILEELKPVLYQVDLMQSDSRLRHFYTVLSSCVVSTEVLQNEIEGLRESIKWELAERKFAFIPIEKVQFFEQEKLFGEQVYDSFPEARAEIKAAGNCLAVDLNTAAVFHLMRTVEFGLRRLAKKLRVRRANKLPIDMNTWGTILKALNQKVEGKFPKTAKGQCESEFYKDLLREVREFKDIFRDKVMHTRVAYDELKARSALLHVGNFLQRLAKDV